MNHHYDVGRGSSRPGYIHPTGSITSVTDAALQKAVQGDITAKLLQQPNANRLYGTS